MAVSLRYSPLLPSSLTAGISRPRLPHCALSGSTSVLPADLAAGAREDRCSLSAATICIGPLRDRADHGRALSGDLEGRNGRCSSSSAPSSASSQSRPAIPRHPLSTSAPPSPAAHLSHSSVSPPPPPLSGQTELEHLAVIRDSGTLPFIPPSAVVAFSAVPEAFDTLGGLSREAVEANVFTFGVLVRGLARDGRLHEARTLLLEMLGKGIRVDAGVYVAVFEALVGGRLEEAGELLEEMRGKGFVPNARAVRELIGLREPMAQCFLELFFDRDSAVREGVVAGLLGSLLDPSLVDEAL